MLILLRIELQLARSGCSLPLLRWHPHRQVSAVCFRGSTIDRQYHRPSLQHSLSVKGTLLNHIMKGVAMQAHICYGSARFGSNWGLNMSKLPVSSTYRFLCIE